MINMQPCCTVVLYPAALKFCNNTALYFNSKINKISIYSAKLFVANIPVFLQKSPLHCCTMLKKLYGFPYISLQVTGTEITKVPTFLNSKRYMKTKSCCALLGKTDKKRHGWENIIVITWPSGICLGDEKIQKWRL